MKWIIRVLSLVAVIIAWQVVYQLGLINRLLFPAPTVIASSLVQLIRSGVLQQQLSISLVELATGFGLAVLVGLPVGLLIGWFRSLQATVKPYVTMFYVTPAIVFIFIFVYVFGFETQAKILYIFFGSTPVLILNVEAGVRHVDSLLLDVGRGFNLTQRKLFTKIIIPGSIPYIISGLRISLGIAFIELVVVEVLLGFSGIGSIIHQAGHEWLWGTVYAGTVVIAVLALALSQMMLPLQRKYGTKYRS